MCGFFGAISTYENLNLDSIYKASKRMSHRGPDDFGYFFSNKNDFRSSKYNRNNKEINFNNLLNEINIQKYNVAFFFYRLSIIDLSDEGHQPFYENERYILNFNGEIYNYVELREYLKTQNFEFKSKSDTEVLYKLLVNEKLDCLNKLNGMFAISLYDKVSKKLFLVRDRFGVKPLYYSIVNEKFYFSSEIKPLLEINEKSKKINQDIFLSFLDNDNIANFKETPFSGLYQVKSGSYLEVSFNNKSHEYKEVRWYQPELLRSNVIFKDAQEKLVSQFSNSVKIRMRSDAKFGVFLSGGLDSSLISILASKDKKIETISFKSDLKKYNEEEFVKNVLNENQNISNLSFTFSETDYLKNINEVVVSQEMPFYNSSTVTEYLLYKKTSEMGYKVMLDGHGADEMLLGYDYLKFIKNANDLKKKDINLTLKLIKNLFSKNIKSTVINFIRLAQSIRNNFSDSKLNDLIKDLFFETNLPKQLTMVDRNSMANGIENRSPFLDYRIVELIFSLPINQLVSDNKSKYILRESFRNIYPKKIYLRNNKVGYSLEELKFKKSYINSFYTDNFDYMKNNIPNKVINKIEQKKISEIEKIFIKKTISIWANKLKLNF